MTCHPDRLDTDNARDLDQILDRSEVLATTRRQVGEFAEMLTGRHGERLRDWMRESTPPARRRCAPSPRGCAPTSTPSPTG